MKVDVIICTKNRPHLLRKAVQQARNSVPTNNVIVVDSTPNPNMNLLNSLNVKLVFTPDVKIGYARQRGLMEATTKYVVFLDDDLELERNWFDPLFKELCSDEKVVAVSPKIVYGYKTDPVLRKLFGGKYSTSKHGGSAGAAIMDRTKVLAIGGYNKNMHWGEDGELFMRIEKHGLKWLRIRAFTAHHPCTFKQHLQKALRNGAGMASIWKAGSDLPLFPWMVKMARRFLVAPIILTFARREPRILVYHSLYHLLYLLSFLIELNK